MWQQEESEVARRAAAPVDELHEAALQHIFSVPGGQVCYVGTATPHVQRALEVDDNLDSIWPVGR